jgi:hypothetical protein
MSSDAIPQLPPAIPVGMEAALGVALPSALEYQIAESKALAVRLGVGLENDAALEDSKVEAEAAKVRHQAIKMPDFWQAIASDNDLDSPARARSVVQSALKLATEQARDHGSFRMGSLLKFTRLKRGSDLELTSIDITPLAKVHRCAQ